MLKEEEIEVFDEPSLRYFVQFLLKLVKEEASSVPNGGAVESTTSSEEEAGHIAVEATRRISPKPVRVMQTNCK